MSLAVVLLGNLFVPTCKPHEPITTIRAGPRIGSMNYAVRTRIPTGGLAAVPPDSHNDEPGRGEK
jgi:hypothetical protein